MKIFNNVIFLYDSSPGLNPSFEMVILDNVFIMSHLLFRYSITIIDKNKDY
jgi:hypothetical protein